MSQLSRKRPDVISSGCQKNFITLLVCLLTLCVSQLSLAAIPFPDQSNGQPTLAPMIEKVSPAVVNISVTTKLPTANNPLMNDPFFRHFFNLPQQMPQQRRQQPQAAGSGVIIDAKKGIIITNHHVIDGADKIEVHFADGDSTQAKLLGSDPEVDVAVLEVVNKKDIKDRAQVVIGDSETLRVGDFVVAIGNPFGLRQTVTTGIISALGRSGLGIEGYENFIQTDASINPGNSGGALVSLNGELIGINTAILAPAGGNVGIGFAIPMQMVNSSLDQILKYGEVKRGKIGVLIQDLSPALAEAFGLDRNQKGVLISEIQPDAAAAKGGLRTGDIVVGVDGKSLNSVAMLRNIIGLKPIGTEIEVKFLRNGREKTTKVVIGDDQGFLTSATQRSPTVSSTLSAVDPRLEGIEFVERNQQVIISSIQPASPAFYTGLQEGDVIEQLNKREISNLQELQSAVEEDAPLLLRVIRDGNALYLVIQS